MDASKTQTVVLQNAIFPFALQSVLSEICSQALFALVQRAFVIKGSCGTITAPCIMHMLHHSEPRNMDAFQHVINGISADIEEENAFEKCTGSILDSCSAPEVKGRISQGHFSEWMLVAKNKDDEEEDEDEEDDDDDAEGDDDDDEGDDEEGDDDEGAEGEGEEGEGDEDDEEDEADDDDEDDDEEDEDDDEDEDELPPKKLKK